DVFAALARPGRDPRDELPPPIFKTGILKIEDVTPGMELKGTVLNVVPFGAFIDIGVKESGLVHISQLANRYIKSPYDVVSGGDRPPQGDGPRPQRSRRFEPRPQQPPMPAQPVGPPPPPRKPKPIPKLTEEKKTGKAALNTFGELFAFFKSKDEPPPAPAPESK